MSAFIVSKKHVDTLVQSAIAGPSDHHGWHDSGERFFRWYYDGQSRRLDPFADEPRERGRTEIVTPSMLGQLLWDENRRSVDHRYDEENVEQPYLFEPVTRPGVMMIGAAGLTIAIESLVTAAELACGINCYEYQSCEHDDWGSSEAFAICRSMKENILRTLPGYSAAPWGWD